MAGRRGIVYNSCFRAEDPYEASPRTTHWRRRKNSFFDNSLGNDHTDINTVRKLAKTCEKDDVNTFNHRPNIVTQLQDTSNNSEGSGLESVIDASVDAPTTTEFQDAEITLDGSYDTVDADPDGDTTRDNTAGFESVSSELLFNQGSYNYDAMTASIREDEEKSEEVVDDTVNDADELRKDDEFVYQTTPEIIWETNDSTDEDDETFTGDIKKTNNSPTSSSDAVSLYDGCSLSLSDSMLLTLTLALRHDLTKECVSDLLTLIELHCKTPNSCKTSLYLFQKYFSCTKTPIVCHMFCNGCGIYIGEKQKPNGICPNNSCKKDLTNDKNISFFIEISIKNQLQKFFARKNFHLNLLERFKRKHSENIEDIYDGELYKEQLQTGGFLTETNNLSLLWYTDGAQPFRSSKKSLWPVYFALNELPYHKRMNADNLLYAGLWFGEGKPNMSSYLKPICETLASFQSSGISIQCMHCSSEIKIRLMLLGGTCDLPAKASVLNMTQFNGEFGCSKCKQPGKVVVSGGGHARVFPFDTNNIDGPRRDQNELIKFSFEAVETNKIVYGVKGPSWFSNLRCHDLVRGTAIDYMHGVLLGLVRKLLHLWFDTKYSKEPFSISHMTQAVDRRLLEIKPPSFISRLPRALGTHMAYWKANECRNWLFFYSVPVLSNVLPEEYFQHHLLLVEALFILNKKSISPDELLHAKRVLIHYCMMFETLYGEQHMSINVHQLLHLVDVVKQLGPLWVYSCFTFESINGRLLKFIHGGSKPLSQIATAVSAMLKIPEMGEELENQGTRVESFYKHLRDTGRQLAIGEKISDHIFVLGKMKLDRSPEVLALVSSSCPGSKGVLSFLRILKNGIMICGKQYTQSKERNSSVVIRKSDEQVMEIQKFLKVKQCSCLINACICQGSFFALVKTFNAVKEADSLCSDSVTQVKLSNVKLVTLPLSNHLALINIAEIEDVCVYVEVSFSNRAFVSVSPNHIEGD